MIYVRCADSHRDEFIAGRIEQNEWETKQNPQNVSPNRDIHNICV